MSAIIKACLISNRPKNTGKQCDSAMVATAMLIAMESGLEFDDADLADPVTWLTLLIHQKKAFPLFGQKAPIREINNNKEADVIVALDDGLQVFLRFGLYNREFGTNKGGLCYAEALASFLNTGMDIVEIDQLGQLLARKNEGGLTYSPLITDFLKPMSPTLANFKDTPYKNHFGYSFSPVELINNGIIFKGASALLSMQGLIDSEITKAAAATTTILKVAIKTTCSDENVIAKFTEPEWEQVENFVVQDVATLGTNVVFTAVNLVSGHLEIVGTYVTGHTYRVWGATPEVWLSNDIEGYDASENFIDILIP